MYTTPIQEAKKEHRMTTDHLNLTIEFLENRIGGLRLITQANWVVECLLSSRAALRRSLRDEPSREYLDAPGVYLLVGPPDPSAGGLQPGDQLYVGQADSVADRLDGHLKSESKQWWRTAVVLKRPKKNPLNLSHCKFLESKLCKFARNAGTCTLTNKVDPQLPFLSQSEESSAEDFFQKALIILSVFGWNFFQLEQTPEQPPESEGPALPARLKPLLDEIRKAVTGPAFPKAEWYPTDT